jgi:hypothetical protein
MKKTTKGSHRAAAGVHGADKNGNTKEVKIFF